MSAAVAATQAVADAKERGCGDSDVLRAIGSAIGGVMHSITDEFDEEEDDDIEPYRLEEADQACSEAIDMIQEISEREQDLHIQCLAKGKFRGRCVRYVKF